MSVLGLVTCRTGSNSQLLKISRVVFSMLISSPWAILKDIYQSQPRGKAHSINGIKEIWMGFGVILVKGDSAFIDQKVNSVLWSS
ncbi:hypothetical protein PS850_03524 [Pseudomonas fluorescens]|nr:hypothetical protein PS850_03524 [Pseudomonas fluorescens]